MFLTRRTQVLLFFSATVVGICGCGAAPPPEPTVTEIRIAVPAKGPDGPISRPFHRWKEKWEAETGAKLTLVEIPEADLPERVLLAFKSDEGKLDGAVVPAWLDGDLTSAGAVARMDDFRLSKEFPLWSDESVAPPLLKLHRWGDSPTSCPLTADAVVLYSRKDVLSDAKHKEGFEKKTGEHLREPQSWEELATICEYFAGLDWNGDGKQDEHGVSMHLGPGAAAQQFLALSASYVVNPGPRVTSEHNVYFFNHETMAPLIDSPGHAKGLELLRRLAKFGDTRQLNWRPADAWADFLVGKSLFCFTTPELGRLAQDSADSVVKGKIGCQILPGAKELWSFKDKRFKTLSKPNVVANVVGPNWHGVIAKSSANASLVYHLFAYQANRLVNMANVVDNRSGVHLGRSYQFVPPHGEAAPADYEKGGFNLSDLKEISGAYYENYYRAPATLEYLRLPGALKFKAALDDSLAEAFANPSIPADAILKTTAERFRKIVGEVELKLGEGRLKEMYRQSIGFKPPAQ